MLLELMERRHDTGSTVFATQYPKKDWHQRLGGGVRADAIMDRIVHTAIWINTGTINNARPSGPDPDPLTNGERQRHPPLLALTRTTRWRPNPITGGAQSQERVAPRPPNTHGGGVRRRHVDEVAGPQDRSRTSVTTST